MLLRRLGLNQRMGCKDGGCVTRGIAGYGLVHVDAMTQALIQEKNNRQIMRLVLIVEAKSHKPNTFALC
jgi:hypothetical protein